MSVDGTDCPVQELSKFNPAYYIHKLHRAGLRYKLAVGLYAPRIVWVNGPYLCGSYPDVLIFRLKLRDNLLAEESVLTDGGFHVGKCVHSIPEEDVGFTTLVRAIHEALNCLFNG